MSANIHAVFRDTYMLLETFEKGLNIAGYIPFVGTISGYIRNNYSNLQMITGLAIAILAGATHLQGNLNSVVYLTFAVTLFAHGVLNLIRSYFEVVPGLPLITTLPYDLYATYYVGRRFFSYL